jgi:hypothetical protein
MKLQSSMSRRDLTRWRASRRPCSEGGSYQWIQVSSSTPTEQSFIRPPHRELSRGGTTCGYPEPGPCLTHRWQWLLHGRRRSVEQRRHASSALATVHVVCAVAPEHGFDRNTFLHVGHSYCVCFCMIGAHTLLSSSSSESSRERAWPMISRHPPPALPHQTLSSLAQRRLIRLQIDYECG